MGTRDVIADEMYRKTQSLYQLEDDYRLWTREQDRLQDDLFQRSKLLKRMIQQEQEYGQAILRRFGYSHQEGASFFNELDWLLQDSEHHHRRLQQEIEWKREDEHSTFLRKQRDIEEEIDQLRRQYASTDK